MYKLFIGEWAKEKDVTLASLSQKIGITPSSLSQINKGAYSPKLETLDKISDVLGIEAYMLFVSPDVYVGKKIGLVCPHCGKPITIKIE